MITEMSTDFDLIPMVHDPLEELEIEERRRLAAQAAALLDALPRRYRLALSCHFGLETEVRTLSQLARQEGVSRQAASLWWKRGLTLLQDRFRYRSEYH